MLKAGSDSQRHVVSLLMQAIGVSLAELGRRYVILAANKEPYTDGTGDLGCEIDRRETSDWG